MFFKGVFKNFLHAWMWGIKKYLNKYPARCDVDFLINAIYLLMNFAFERKSSEENEEEILELFDLFPLRKFTLG